MVRSTFFQITNMAKQVTDFRLFHEKGYEGLYHAEIRRTDGTVEIYDIETSEGEDGKSIDVLVANCEDDALDALIRTAIAVVEG